MSTNKYGDLNGYGHMLKLIERIEERTEVTAKQVEYLQDSLSDPLRTIAKNTGSMSESLVEFRDENKELIQIIAGKWQVPMPIFLVVVAVFAVWIVADKVHQTGTEVNISPSDFQIKQNNNGSRNSQTSPQEAAHP